MAFILSPELQFDEALFCLIRLYPECVANKRNGGWPTRQYSQEQANVTKEQMPGATKISASSFVQMKSRLSFIELESVIRAAKT